MPLLITLMILLLWCSDSYPQESPKPKNIFILISDGWGINQILAANYWHNTDSTVYQRFPVRYYMSTYQGIQAPPAENPGLESCNTGYNSAMAWSDTNYVKSGYTDSAPAATSMASGYKSADEAIGVDIFGHGVELITEHAVQSGKSAGVVTSVPWSHATPAAFSTHHVNRDQYQEIALSMLLESRLSVIAGCGHPYYDDNSDRKTSGFYFDYVGGQAAWDTLAKGISNTFSIGSPGGRIEPMDIDLDGISDPWTLTQDSADVVNLMRTTTPPKRLLGTAKCATTLNQGRTVSSDLPYGDSKNDSVPHLYQLALAAINVMDENPLGFLLMVEGGAVDWANHENQKQRLIEEQQDFNVMVDSVVAWVLQNGGWEKNLVIVTGDHECGYLTSPDYDEAHITDGYFIRDNGPGSMPEMKYNSSSHTNSLIPFYAKGSGSQLFRLYADEIDYMFGYYIDNTEVGLACKDLLRSYPMPEPKNIIYMVGEGIGFNHLLASELYKGQQSEIFEHQLSGADFFSAPMSTYPGKIFPPDMPEIIADYNTGYQSAQAWSDPFYLNNVHTDAAAAATSMYSGVKTANGSIGADYRGTELKNLADRAFEIGKSLGVVSSIQFSKETSASFIAHGICCSDVAQTANEMIIDSKLSVLFGCGAPDFDNDGMEISPVDYSYVGGSATWDELNLGTPVFSTATIHNNHTVQDISGDGKPDPWTMIRDSAEFTDLAVGKTPLRLIGIPNISGTLQQERTRSGSPSAFEVPFNQNVPTLSDMTKAALNILDKNRNGFVLLIDGGAIDQASRSGQLERVIEEQIDFNRAVNDVIYWVNHFSSWDSTLLIIAGSYESGYLTGPDYHVSNMIDGYPVADNGQGNLPSAVFRSDHITNMLVPFMAHGAGAEIIAEYATCYDYVYGNYLNNTEPAQAILKMWEELPADIPDIRLSDLITDADVGMAANHSSEEVFIFPTLVRDYIRVSIPESWNAIVQVYSVNGRLIHHQLVSGSATLDMKGLPPGMYIIRVMAGDILHIDRFIKL